MNDEAKRDDEVTPAGAVEVNEQDLDQAAGGAIFMQTPVEQQDIHLSAQATPELKDPSLKYCSDGTAGFTPQFSPEKKL